MKKVNADSVIKFFVSVIGLSVIFIVLKELSHIFVPFVIAYFLFFFFEPLNNFFEKKKIPLGIIILIDIVLTISLLYGISRGVVDSVLQFSAELPDYEMKLNKIIGTFFKSIGIKDYYYTHFKISEALRELDYSVIAGGVLSSTFSVFTSIFLVLFFFIFISSGHDKIVDAIRMRFVQKEVNASIKKIKKSSDTKNDSSLEENIQNLTIQREVKLKKTFKDITEQVQKYVVTKFFISISVGIVMGLMLWLFDVKFFVIWALFAVILNFIPNIGSVIAVFFPVLMTLVQHESLGYALIVLAVLIFVQNVIGNILEPKIFGNRLGLNPLVILISLLIWGYLWGIIGMFLSVPLTAILKIILSNSTSKNVRFISQLMSN